MKKKRQKKKSDLHSLSAETLLQRGNASLANGQFRDATQAFKELRDKAPDQPWKPLLAQAYAGWAEECYAKGLYREAIPLFEEQARLTEQPVPPDRLLICLVNSRRWEAAATLYFECEQPLREQDPGLWLEAGSLLAAHALAGTAGILKVAPAESAFRRQATAALEALTAYTNGETETITPLLGRLSLRGPFKVFRLLLKALLLMDKDCAGAERLLDSIPANTPFHGLVPVLQACLPSRSLTVATLQPLDKAQQKVIAAVRGIESKSLDFLHRWAEVHERSRQKPEGKSGCQKLALLDRVKSRLPLADLRRTALEMVVQQPLCRSAFEKVFGVLTAFEEARIFAIVLEMGESWEDGAARAWEQALQAHREAPPESRDPSLDAGGWGWEYEHALILRHIVALGKTAFPPNERKTAAYLIESLEHDPEDRETHISLIQHFKGADEECEPDDRKRNFWINAAVKLYPDDPEFLTEAMDAALENNAFKKAARLGKRILDIDPINVGVRTRILAAHLSHARKSVVGKERFDLARKEIDQARKLERPGILPGRTDLCHGLIERLAGRKAESDRLIAQGRQAQGGDPAESGTLLLLEALSFPLPTKEFAGLEREMARDFRKTPPRPQAVVGILRTLEQADGSDSFFEIEKGAVARLLRALKPYLKSAATCDQSQKDRCTVLRLLHHLGDYDLLKGWTKAVEVSEDEDDEITFYRLVARYSGRSERMSSEEEIMLDVILEDAQNNGNTDLAERVESFLEAGEPYRRRWMPKEKIIPEEVEKLAERFLVELFEDYFGEDNVNKFRGELRKIRSDREFEDFQAFLTYKHEDFFSGRDDGPPLELFPKFLEVLYKEEKKKKSKGNKDKPDPGDGPEQMELF